MPAIAASEADAEGDAKEAGTSMAVATVGASTSMAGVQAAKETNGSIIKLLVAAVQAVQTGVQGDKLGPCISGGQGSGGKGAGGGLGHAGGVKGKHHGSSSRSRCNGGGPDDSEQDGPKTGVSPILLLSGVGTDFWAAVPATGA